jgi:hypothetical protein
VRAGAGEALVNGKLSTAATTSAAHFDISTPELRRS